MEEALSKVLMATADVTPEMAETARAKFLNGLMQETIADVDPVKSDLVMGELQEAFVNLFALMKQIQKREGN